MKLTDLPKGIFWEPRRQRFRVRLYRRSVVVWRSYHSTFAEALESLSKAKQAQSDWHPLEVEHRFAPVPQKVIDLFKCL